MRAGTNRAQAPLHRKAADVAASGSCVMNLVRRGVFFVVLASFGLSLAACEHTVRGVGRDVQDTGNAVEDTVQGNP
ncbi:entericidin, EcnA/B family [Afifella marina DSM 2698]|nr:entericidin, EcnA/B family [Afifella marina DSM 2698]MBK1627327.1 entericidin, EcnA/B family [Afifella marina]MBK5918643.1 hypothetical protein [Afifella marina]RAI22734.1 hypothetical protein CH311_03465 [Afifella marina DSM 2698]